MANMYNKKSKTNWMKYGYLLMSMIFFLMDIYVMTLLPNVFFSGAGFKVMGLYFLVFLALGGLANHYYHKFNRSSAIDYSYEVTNDALSRLPNEYEVYNDVCVGEARLDHVVVGNNGVFVVVSRSVNGTVHCDEHDRRWTVEKVGRRGGEYSSSMANPIKQLKWQIHELVEYLRGNGCNVWVDGCVFFSSEETELAHRPDGVFDSQNAFTNFIVNYESKKNINPQVIVRAKELLSNVPQ